MKPQEIKKIMEEVNSDGLSLDELLVNIGKRLEPKFEINADNSEYYNQLKYYFTNDSRFNGDLNKGLLLVGNNGSGKTLALTIFQIITLIKDKGNFFMMYDTDEIIDEFTKYGRPSIEQFNNYGDIAIDELGQDSGLHNFFGTKEDPTELLLSRRYIVFKSNGFKTHCISNLDANALQERFSPKIYDRICEMFNLMPFVGKSWRRK
ncbi:MAG: hypothetical protein NT007_01200 [Candidatus Kapabacteria bacterium]|nr:hypothetical protein [Candidatus Kapabacteria bacterium]